MVVLVEEQPLRALVTRIVRYEQVSAVGDEHAVSIKCPEFLVNTDDMAIVPLLQFIRLGVAGQLAEEVLVARRLAGIEIAVVEARAKTEREIAAVRIDRATATSDLAHQPIHRREDDQRIAVKAMLARAGVARAGCTRTSTAARDGGPRRVMGRDCPELLNDLVAEKELKELGLGHIGGQFDVIETGVITPVPSIMRPFWASALRNLPEAPPREASSLASMLDILATKCRSNGSLAGRRSTDLPPVARVIPDCFRRWVNTVLQAASVTPLPIRYVGPDGIGNNPENESASASSCRRCCIAGGFRTHHEPPRPGLPPPEWSTR